MKGTAIGGGALLLSMVLCGTLLGAAATPLLLDFGGAGSMRFRGFAKVTEKDAYDAKKGYGFVSTDKLLGTRSAFPDDLAGDVVVGTAFTFRVDLPDGDYRVQYIAYGVDYEGGLSQDPYSITIGDYRMGWKPTAAEFFSEKELFYGIGDDYYPGKDYWPYVEKVYPTRTADVTVKGGKMEVVGEGAGIASLVIYPKADEAKMAKEMEVRLKQRREQLGQDYFLVKVPKANAQTFEVTAREQQGGFIVFFPGRSQTVYPSTVPTVETTGTKLSLAVARGERGVATLAVHPLKAFESMEVSVTDLDTPNGGRLGADLVDVRLIRYFERPHESRTTYAPSPGQLVKRPSKLYPGLTRQYWLIVRVPVGTAAGLYKGSVQLKADGKVTAVPFEVTVHPFVLPESSRAAYGYYYSAPLETAYLKQYPLAGLTLEKTLERELIDMKDHGLNSIQVPLPRIVGAENDRMRFDWSELEVYAKLMKKHGIGTQNLPTWYALGFGRFLMRRTGGEFTPEFNRIMKNSIPETHKWWKDQGMEMLYWVVDEPRETGINPWNRNLKDTISYLKLYREIDPAIKTTVTPMGDSQGGVDYLPMVPLMDVLQTHPWKNSEKQITMAVEAGKPVLWSYNAGNDRLSFGFSLWKLKAHGRYQWHYQWPDTCYVPFRGDHWAVVYPSPEGPVPTWTYEQVALGIVDHRYLELMETLIAEGKAKGKNVTTAEALLKELDAGVPRWPEQGLATGEEAGAGYTGDVNAKLDPWRQRLAEEITKLSR